MFEQSISRITEATARLQAASASLCATVERWQIVMTAKIAGTPLDSMSMRFALESEHILPRWKRQPLAFHQLASGEVVQFGGKPETHTVRTLYMRSDWNVGDVGYLFQVVEASRVIGADEANRILRTMKPDRAYGKRSPAEADVDPYLPQWRARPERRLSPRELVLESGLTGRALERELRRVK